MKESTHPARVFLAVISITIAFLASGHANVIIGTGADTSYAVIEAGAFGEPLIYEYHYNYDPSNPLDAFALLTAIDSVDPALSLGFLNFGDNVSPSYFLDSITYGTTKLVSTPFPDIGPFWAQWVSGAEAGYPESGSIPLGVWSFGSGISSPYRSIGPGSWDGFVFNSGDSPPSVNPVLANPGSGSPASGNPVPESQSTFPLLAGTTVVLWILRRRHAQNRI